MKLPRGRPGSTSPARTGPWGWRRWSSSTRPGTGRETLASGRSTRWIFSERWPFTWTIGDLVPLSFYLSVEFQRWSCSFILYPLIFNWTFKGDLVLCHPSTGQAALWSPRIKWPLEQVFCLQITTVSHYKSSFWTGLQQMLSLWILNTHCLLTNKKI